MEQKPDSGAAGDDDRLLALSLVLLNRLEFELKVNGILKQQVQTLKGGGK